MSTIDIHPSTIMDEILIKTWRHRKLHIPDYQRNYVWDEEKIEDFWSDLVERRTLPFLGSFIVKEEWNDNNLDIVDWQQRTITIAIFLSALRNVAKNYDLTLSKKVQEYLEEDDLTWWFTGNFFLECRSNVQPYFAENVLNYDWDIKKYKWPKIKKTQESIRNIQKNYLHIVNLLEEYLEWKNDKLPYLKKILEKILTYEIVVIKVKTDEEAYVAFEIVNAGWVKLENIDLLKNLFIKESYWTPVQEIVKTRWSEMTENINESDTKWNVESFLKHFRSARNWYIVWKDLYASFKNLLKDAEVDQISKELLEDSKLYRDFWSPEWEVFLERSDYNSQIIKSLWAIKSFWVTQAYILFLAVLRYKNEIWDRRVRNIFKLIEYFHFMYSIIWKWQANKVEKIYGKYCKIFIEAIDYIKENQLDEWKWSHYMSQKFDQLRQDLRNLLNEFVPEEWFITSFSNLQLKSWNKDIIRYVLSQYELSLTTWWTEPNFEITNIEHIYPQNENKQSESNNQINNIWNLILLEKFLNSKCWNEPLSKKIPIYKENNTFIQVREIVEYYENNPDSDTRSESYIQERSKNMAKQIYDYIQWQINKM